MLVNWKALKLTKEQYRFGLVELICSEEFENPDPDTNWHKAELDDLFDDEPEMQIIQKEAEKEAEEKEEKLMKASGQKRKISTIMLTNI